MKRTISLLLILLLLATGFAIPAICESVALGDELSFCVMEKESQRILYGANLEKNMPIASTTKVLTAITVIEEIEDVQKVFEIPKEAVGVEGSSIYLKEGERVSVLELLYGLMLQSGNDSAVALAIITSGSVENFARQMNIKAREIGTKNSHFVNPHGLHHDNHYSSAYDLALISSYALQNPLFAKISSTKRYEGERGSYNNKNRMLGEFEGGTGIKTGYTKNAGRCLVSSAKRGNMELVCVVLNCPSMFATSKEKLEKAFAEYEMKKVCEKGEVKKIQVTGMFKRSVPIGVNAEILVPVKKDGSERVQIRENYAKSLDFPVKKGLLAGEIEIYVQNNLIFRKKVYTMNEVGINNIFF